MKISKLGLGVASFLVIFACAAAVISIRHGYRYSDRLVKVVNAAALVTRVNGSQPRVPIPQLRLSGQVVELAAGAPLTVTATVGSITFPATVQGNTYTVYIGRPAPQQMVAVEARSPRVHYRSVVGSAGRLRAQAGSDAHLTLAEQPSLRISPYSTALGWLVRVALGDRDATSDAEFEKTTRIAASSGLELAAYALAATAKGQLELPGGFTDGFQLLRDRDAFREFVMYSTFREASAGYLFEQPQEATLSGSEGLPNQLVFVDGMPRDQLPIWMGHVFLLGRRGDGRFDFNERVPVLDPTHALAVDGQGRIQLTPIGNQVRVTQKEFLGVDDYGYPYSELRWVDRTAVGRTLKRLTRGDATSVWVMRSVWNDREQLDPSAPVVQEVDYQVLSSTELGAWSVPDAWSSVAASTTTLPWKCTESVPPEETANDMWDCGYVEHRFETNGSGSIADYGWKVDAQTMLPTPTRSLAFTWLRGTQGALDITDGTVATSFWRLKDYPGDIGPVFYHTKALTGPSSGKTLVGINMAARKTMAPWTQGAAAGNWRSASFVYQPDWYKEPGLIYWEQRNAGGAGQESYGPDGQENGLQPISWQFAGNAAYDKRIRLYGSTPPYPYVENCDTAAANGADYCYIRMRYFKPIARSGNRYYGIEEIYTGYIYPEYPEESNFKRLRSELAYYDCESGACAAPSAIPATQGVRVRATLGTRQRVPAAATMQPRARAQRVANRHN